LRHLATEPVDYVITDMIMPEMDGVELMQVLQRERPTLPVIALSGIEDAVEYRRIAMHLGARVMLRKPVKGVDLIRAVKDELAQRHSSDARKVEFAQSA
jgi:two-component system response regulator YesN